MDSDRAGSQCGLKIGRIGRCRCPPTDGRGAGASVRQLSGGDARRGLVRVPMGGRSVRPAAGGGPGGYEMQVGHARVWRRSMGSRCRTRPATIDSDYRGPLGVSLINLGLEPYTIRHGDRVAQVVGPRWCRGVHGGRALDDTARGTGGSGRRGWDGRNTLGHSLAF